MRPFATFFRKPIYCNSMGLRRRRLSAYLSQMEKRGYFGVPNTKGHGHVRHRRIYRKTLGTRIPR